MQNIRSKNTRIEKQIFSLLAKSRIKFRKHYPIEGRPDVAFPDNKTAVFIDSDFWHGWRLSQWVSKLPKVYWQDKIRNNKKRDQRISRLLKRKGWSVIRIWEHQVLKDPQKCLAIIKTKLK